MCFIRAHYLQAHPDARSYRMWWQFVRPRIRARRGTAGTQKGRGSDRNFNLLNKATTERAGRILKDPGIWMHDPRLLPIAFA